MKKFFQVFVSTLFITEFVVLLFVSPLQVMANSSQLPPIILTDGNFVQNTPGFNATSILGILKKIQSPLADFQRQVDDQTLNGGDIFWVTSQQRDFFISPKVLLTIYLSLYGPSQMPSGDVLQINRELAASLWNNYVSYKDGSRKFSLKNGTMLAIDNDSNAGTFALKSVLARQAADQAELNKLTQDWVNSYINLFDHSPEVDTSGKVIVPDVAPFLNLPFTQPAGGFLKVNSFFDHNRPSVFDDSILRFDGKKIGSASFNTCEIGVSCYGGHNGVDYSTGAKRPILAAAAGKVVYKYFNTNPSKGYIDSGLIIDHGNGYMTAYWHMDPIMVKFGDQVSAGQQIGLSGNIGKSSGAHLHFGLRISDGSKSVDPYGWWAPGVSDVWGDSKWMWAGDLIADNGEAQMQLFYNNYWNYDPAGFGGSSYFTNAVTTAAKVTNWGVWGTTISDLGQYDVYAYWPKRDDNATGVSYRVFSEDGAKDVAINQAADGNRWVKLGTYQFAKSSYTVILTDLNKGTGNRVYFDAIQWVKSGNAPLESNLSTTPVVTPTETLPSTSGSNAVTALSITPTPILSNNPAVSPVVTSTPMPAAPTSARQSASPTPAAKTNGDEIQQAITIPLDATWQTTMNTQLATTAADDPTFNCSMPANSKGSHSVWYQFSPNQSGKWNVSTQGSNYDTILLVWSGTPGKLNLERCNNNISSPSNLQSASQTNVVTGKTYYVEVVGSEPDSAGLLNLNSSFHP